MQLLPFPNSYNVEAALCFESAFARILKSRAAAVMLLLVALLLPMESFAANCNLAGMVCLDATPCKMIQGIQVCLSGTNPMPPGALVATQPCWQAQGTYNCANTTSTAQDTCDPFKKDTNCGIIGAKCVEQDTAGNCTLYTDTYQCQTGGGVAQVTTDCSSQRYCANGSCFTKKDKANDSLGKIASAMELTRQAGFYMDASSQTVFGGQANWCSQNTAGLSNCCKPNKEGGKFSDAVIADELVKNGWNQWVKHVIGSDYTFDTLFDKAQPYVKQAIDGMTEVVNGWVGSGAEASVTAAAGSVANQAAGTAGNIANTGTTAAAGAGGAVATGTSVSGLVGGAIGQTAANMLVGNQGQVGNAVVGAVGNQLGSYAGTYAWTYGTSAMGYGTGAAAGMSGTAGGTAGVQALSFCWACLAAAVIIAVMLALLACDENEAKTQMRLGAGICHFVGTTCSRKFPGTDICLTNRQHYCCFNSKLAKIVQQQGRPQLQRGWGSADSPDCSGISIDDLQALDFSKMDLSEFVADVKTRVAPDPEQLKKNVQARIADYFDSRPAGQMTGAIPGPTAGTPRTITVNVIEPQNQTTTAMPECASTLTNTQIDKVTGNRAGAFQITSCLPNGTAWFSYSGNCPLLVTAPVAQVQVPLDVSGNATFPVTVPAACLASTTPATINMWTAIMQEAATTQSVGKFDVIWK